MGGGNGMRIAGGRQGGRGVRATAGEGVRPSTARVREALFAMLGARVSGAWALDLYAGSGALGLEALSRGAARVWFVERQPEHAEMVRQNLKAHGLVEHGRVVTGSATDPMVFARLGEALERETGQRDVFSLVLMDPPYRQGLVGATLDLCGRSGILAPEAWAVAEHEPGCPDGIAGREGWLWRESRRYGESVLTFWSRIPSTKPVARIDNNE